MKQAVIILWIACALTLTETGCRTAYIAPYNSPEWDLAVKRGDEMLRTLAMLTPEQAKNFDDSAIVGQTVAFYGWPACPCNDVDTGTNNIGVSIPGYYIRVINKSGADLRPRAAGWEVTIRGKVVMVLPAHKIIVIQIKDEDYCVGSTS